MALVHIQAAALPIQFPVNGPGKPEEGLSVWAPATQVEGLTMVVI